MKQLVQEFSTQLQEALIIGQSYRFNTAKREFSNVVLTGLGGSGIGGSIVQNYVFDSMKVPFIVNKDYFLPAFVDKDTLVIVCSYSGNTEETTMALKAALKAKATIVCVTSGGAIAETAKKKELDCILLPAGMPPRACLGYSLVQVLYTLAHFGLISGGFEKELKASIKLLQSDGKELEREGKALAKKLNGKTPIIYAAADFEGVAIRFRQQINENGKMLAWHHVVPEMNHNELVGWRDKDESRAVVILRNETDFERVQRRFEINKQVIRKYTKNISEVNSRGKSYWEKVFSLVHLTDWCSVYLAEMHGVDATEVKVIDFLKGELAKEA
jgi:glucose/mannose-6-phosphate isomerase